MKKVLCYFDGSCEPKNPGGQMGIGAAIFVDGIKMLSFSSRVPAGPENSNNVAEYMAFETVIDYLIGHDLCNQDIKIQGDSKLVIEQMNFRWKIKDGLYRDYAIRCKEKIITFFPYIKIEWISRDFNSLADQLSRKEGAKA